MALDVESLSRRILFDQRRRERNHENTFYSLLRGRQVSTIYTRWTNLSKCTTACCSAEVLRSFEWMDRYHSDRKRRWNRPYPLEVKKRLGRLPSSKRDSRDQTNIPPRLFATTYAARFWIFSSVSYEIQSRSLNMYSDSAPSGTARRCHRGSLCKRHTYVDTIRLDRERRATDESSHLEIREKTSTACKWAFRAIADRWWVKIVLRGVSELKGPGK